MAKLKDEPRMVQYTKANPPHECRKENKISTMSEDIATLKTALGYKDKHNGEFQKDVEKETSSLSTRIGNIETNMASVNGKMNIIMVLMIPLVIAIVVAIIRS